MKYIVYAINFFLLLMIPVVLFVYPKLNNKKETNIIVKKLNSNDFYDVSEIQLRENYVVKQEYNETTKEIVLNNNKLSVNIAKGNVTNVLEKIVGKMSSYGPDCKGCGGKVGAGQVVTNGNVYYYDKTFGQLRIVAGDSKYPYGTVIRVLNSKYNEPFYAIVLDRGGDIGIGRKFMFDLLFPSEKEANLFGTSYNVTFEVMRYGY